MENLNKYISAINESEIKDILEFSNYFQLTDSTARRKLKKIEDLGYITLSYGGVIELVKQEKISILDEYKENMYIKEKKEIAKNAISKIEDGDILFLDNGTTVRYILKYLKAKDNVIYTNGINHMHFVKENNINLDIRIIPGQIRFKEGAIVGEEALLFLSDLYLDKVFIGANGFDDKYGITTPNEDEKNLKKLVLDLGLNSYILMDQYKKGIKSKFKVCNIDDYEIISNKSEK